MSTLYPVCVAHANDRGYDGTWVTA